MAGCKHCGCSIAPDWIACPACGAEIPQEGLQIQDSVITGDVHTGDVIHHHQHITQVNSPVCSSCSSSNPSIRNCAVDACPNSCCDDCGTYPNESVSLCSSHHITCSCDLVYRTKGEDLIHCEEDECTTWICNRCRRPTMINLGLGGTSYMCKEHNEKITFSNIMVGVGMGLMFIFVIAIL